MIGPIGAGVPGAGAAGMPGVGADPNFGSVAKTPGLGKLGEDQSADGQSFGDMLKDMIIKRPTESQSDADRLAADFAAGKDIDPQTLAVATAKAGIEVQMSTRTISQAVQAVRTLMQMQI